MPTFKPGADVPAGLSNQALLHINRERRELWRRDITKFHPWWRRCEVNVLLVTDGNLDFGQGDFGFSTFVRTLLDDAPLRVAFRVTLAHLRGNGPDMFTAETRIVRRITDFRFDEPTHFTSTQFDEVWLFGFETFFHSSSYPARQADQARYPATQLGNDELLRLQQHMNGGGGIFATGDHGRLGRGLCGHIPRVRNMRWWDNFPNTGDLTNEVSMLGQRRNDTNREGYDAGWTFSDQSDDIPQVVDLHLYSTPLNVLRNARYPHPVLCGRNGRIDVLPDHPHEGECRLPNDLNLTDTPDGSAEYPLIAGSTTTRLAPEIIAHARVPAGNTGLGVTGFKQPTQAHSFPVISAYDGHRAGAGRIVCDSTWHHFVNVNLVGVIEGGAFDEFDTNPIEHGSKHDGFLSSVAGGVALEKIRNYHTNIGVWIAPQSRHACFNRWIWWELVFHDRIMEATLVDPGIALERIPAAVLWSIGAHARDVFGHRAGQCQTLEWVFDWVKTVWPEIVPWINPWEPPPLRPGKGLQGLPTLELMPLVDSALGAALVSLRQALPYPPDKLTDKHDKLAADAVAKGLNFGMQAALAEHATASRQLTKVFKAAQQQAGTK